MKGCGNMKKNIIFIVFIFFILVCPNIVSNAMRPYEFSSRKECEKIELANAKEDGSLEKVECYLDYNTAKSAMDNSQNDGAVLIENGMIINAKYGLIDYDVDYSDSGISTTTVYSSNTSNTSIGYIRTASAWADDAALIDYDYNTNRVKIKISGLIGWIKKYEGNLMMYDIVPITWVKSPHYYQITDSTLTHNFTQNVYGEGKTYGLKLDRKPSMLNPGTYYSYDGHYFYTSLKSMLQDYKNGNFNQSVNSTLPYFNYYQYLSFRTKTTYNAANINDYINSHTGETSKLRNVGDVLIWTQENYGVNAALVLGIGINESGWGTSRISQERNNLFGLNAVDSNPYSSSSTFASPEDCIKTYGYVWLSNWYVQTGDSHYRGPNVGNKLEGLNVRYASDPYWGEHAATHYYELDKTYGFQDQDSYQIAVLNSEYNNTVYAYKTPGGEKVRIYDTSNFYQYNIYTTPIVILGETEGPNVNGSTKWYKIQSNAALDGNLNYIGTSKSVPPVNYDWNTSYAYVPAAYFQKVNTSTTPTPPVTPEAGTGEQTSTDQPPAKPTTPSQPETPPVVIKPISNIVSEANYGYASGVISGITINTGVETIINALKATGAINITLTDVNGNPKSGNAATGDKVIVYNQSGSETLEVVVIGDPSGDGNITAVDYVKIKNHIMNTASLSGIFQAAADVNKDGNITAVDYVNIKNYIMGENSVIK